MSQSYVQSIANPFNRNTPEPKILDGKVTKSSGIRLRATGEIHCSGGTTYIALIPNLSNSVCWKSATDNPSAAFRDHLDTELNRSNVKKIRIVGSALRLSLINSTDGNEGYWEAIRTQTTTPDFSFADSDLAVQMQFREDELEDMSGYESYQKGKLKDLHKYQFKLNASDNDIKFSHVTTDINQFVSEQWDTVIIKITGSTAETPTSTLMYDSISCQEVVFKENTSISRLMTTSEHEPKTRSILSLTRLITPGLQVLK